MKLLAFDASTEWLSVALDDGARVVERDERASNAHGERILPVVGDVLREARVSLGDLDAIAFGAGPGAFTGVRMACGVAQGLGLGTGRPVVAVGTLEALAESARVRHGATRVLAALDARMHEVYIAALVHDGDGWREDVAPEVLAPAGFVAPAGRWCGAGNAFAAYPMLAGLPCLDATWADLRPQAAAIASLARRSISATAPEGIAAAGANPAARDARAGSPVTAAADARPLYVRHRVALTTAEREAGKRL